MNKRGAHYLTATRRMLINICRGDHIPAKQVCHEAKRNIESPVGERSSPLRCVACRLLVGMYRLYVTLGRGNALSVPTAWLGYIYFNEKIAKFRFSLENFVIIHNVLVKMGLLQLFLPDFMKIKLFDLQGDLYEQFDHRRKKLCKNAYERCGDAVGTR